jgi:hypothetical protein
VRNSPQITTAQIEELVRGVNALYAARLRYNRERAAEWRAARDATVHRLHAVLKPAARPYAGQIVAALAAGLLSDARLAFQELADLEAEQGEREAGAAAGREIAALKGELAALQQAHADALAEAAALREEAAQARAELARRPATSTVILPAQTIAVSSPLQRAVLQLMAETGLGRGWRIVARLTAAGYARSPNSVRNAIQKLVERGLVEDYRQHGKPATWALKPGGPRRLVALSEQGRAWCRGGFAQEPAESEIAVAARRHRSVSHGVAILEARDLLRVAGYDVEDDPQAMLASADKWGARAEPDLAVSLEGQPWPVEVQREVSARTLDKWTKSLKLGGRLALVLYSEEARVRQAALLEPARYRLPKGRILLASLEAMEAGAWGWQEVVTRG